MEREREMKCWTAGETKRKAEREIERERERERPLPLVGALNDKPSIQQDPHTPAPEKRDKYARRT